MIKFKKVVKNTSEIKFFTPRNKGIISNSITQNWTDQAILCYTSGCNCSDCTITNGNYSFVCQMPKIIKTLLKEIGPPDKDKINKLLA